MLKNYISQFNHDFFSTYMKIMRLIHKFDRIVIFRHIRPDYDALGSQIGFSTWLKDNFPDKSIKIVGDNHPSFTPRLYREMDKLSENYFHEPFLAIILDVPLVNRICDPRFIYAKKTILIDHHPQGDIKADVKLIYPEASSTSEILVSMCLHFSSLELSKLASTYFYSAIVGDTGKFSFDNISSLTFDVCSELMAKRIDVSWIYQKMFERTTNDLKVEQYILSTYKLTPKGVAYYILNEKVLNQLNINHQIAKLYVNTFANVQGIEIWFCVTEDNSNKKKTIWRVSIRSKRVSLIDVATKYRGGGHTNACGAELYSLNELDNLIKDLEAII